MRWFRSTPPGDPLAVAMTGVKLGDRLLVLGCADVTVIAQLALKPGLTGRTCIVDEHADAVTRAAAAAQQEGGLVEPETAPLTMLPYDEGAFDLVVFNHALGKLPESRRPVHLGEARRVLRQGGRVIAIERAARGGLGALLGGGAVVPASEIERAFTGSGFRAVRTLAEREGLAFIEGAKRD
jgi:ubiquinone/menaquinone biosynthesis C-methylase UbiE